MDDWNADLFLNVIQYLNVVDSGRLALTSRRCCFLVDEFRRIRGAQMVARSLPSNNEAAEAAATNTRNTATETSKAQTLVQSAVQTLQSPPHLALCFNAENRRSFSNSLLSSSSSSSSPLHQELPRWLPKHAATLGVVSSSIQTCNMPQHGELNCESSAGIMLAHLPGTTAVQPFCWEMPSDVFPPRASAVTACRSILQQLKNPRLEQEQYDYQVFLVYACGEEAGLVDDFVTQLQAAYPQSTIVGGICSTGYVSQPTANVTRSDVEQLDMMELLAWYRGLTGASPEIDDTEKGPYVELVWELVQSQPYRIRTIESGAIFGVGLAGQVPVRSVVSRGVQSLTNSNGVREPRQTFQIHEAQLHNPSDPEYMFTTGRSSAGGASQQPPPYHLVKSVRHVETGKIFTLRELANQFHHPDFIGLQRPANPQTGERGDDGFFLHQPHPLSFQLNAYLFLLNQNEAGVTGEGAFANNGALSANASLQGAYMDLLDLTAESCLRDMDSTMASLREETEDEDVLGAIMISCAARGPSASSMLHESMADATRFAKEFSNVPCLGFYAGGEIGPLALAAVGDQKRTSLFRRGQATLQGFTAVFALFIVPKFRLPQDLLLNDDPNSVNQYMEHKYGRDPKLKVA